MRKVQLIIFLAITLCNCYAQGLHQIILKNLEVSVTGDRLIPVEGEQQVWEIDLRKDEEVFQLVSKNTSRVQYVLNGTHVNANPGGDMNKIPYKNNSNEFYSSAHLVLRKDKLPITISVDSTIVATFQLKKHITYQQYSKPKESIFKVGDTLNITKDDPQKTDVIISGVSVSIKDGDNTFNLEDGIITAEVLGNKDSIINSQVTYTVKYKDGKTESSSLYVKIKKGNDNGKNIPIIISVVAFIIAITIFVLILRKRKKHNKDAENSWTKNVISTLLFWQKEKNDTGEKKNSDTNQTDASNDKNLLDSFQVEHTAPQQEIGTEVVIKVYTEQIKKLELRISELERAQGAGIIPENSELRERIKELEESERAKLDEIGELSSENKELTTENKDLKAQLTATISDNASKKDLRNKIEELKGEKNKLIRERQSKERELIDARKNISSLESKVKEKDDKIAEINKQKEEAESNLRIEKKSTAALQKKISSFSKQTYYLYAIDDAIQAVDHSLKHLFTDVRDENLMKRLAQPILSGTAGLDAGLESYLNEWKNTVYDNQKQFFGDDVLNMNDDSVKEKLSEFLEQLALRDSFGKLVRLYLMTNVGWINEKMVAAGFNVDAIQTLFAIFKNMFTLFNIEISYPRLFVDKFDPVRHKDNMRCEIFNYFEPSEKLLAQLKSHENENLIVDITRIGIPNSKTPARRNAMVSLPNF